MRRRGGGSGARRKTDWITTLLYNTTANGDPQFFALIDETDVTTKDDALTVVRCVGDFTAYRAEIGATAAACILSWGIILSDVDEQGNVTPFTPNNDTDLEASWLFHRHQLLDAATAAGQPGSNRLNLPDGAHFDVKVMRKMHQRQALLLVSSVDTLGGGAITDIIYSLSARCLVKLA